jgi:hypothetical protein
VPGSPVLTMEQSPGGVAPVDIMLLSGLFAAIQCDDLDCNCTKSMVFTLMCDLYNTASMPIVDVASFAALHDSSRCVEYFHATLRQCWAA